MLLKPDSIELYKPFQLFQPEDCKKIIKDACQQTPGKRSGVAGNNTGARRTSTTYWYKPSFFNTQDLKYYFDPFHNNGYLVDHVSGPIQVAKYDENQFFGWHYDQFTGKKRTGRLLTLVCTLQPALGASLQTKNHIWQLNTGEAVIFPANVLHRATAPVEGERWSFTTWGVGKITKISKRKGQ